MNKEKVNSMSNETSKEIIKYVSKDSSNEIIRTIAIDDEPLSLMQMGKYIEKCQFLDLCGTFSSANKARKWLENYKVDLIFVDINMPDMTGLDFVKSLTNPPLIVFVTAYPEYAVEGFKLEATDYLVKPISYDEFITSANRCYRRYNERSNNENGNNSNGATNNNEIIFVKSDYKLLAININDIIYIESQSEYVKIFTSSSTPVMTLASLKSFETKLPSDRFIRTHRSYIIGINHVTSFQRRQITMSNKSVLNIGEIYKDSVSKILKEIVS